MIMPMPGASVPLWSRSIESPPYAPLRSDVDVDVAVVGAGITGLTAAMALKEAGARVVVLEMGRVGSGCTGYSTGHVDAHPDVTIESIVRKFSEDAAAQAILIRLEAIRHVEQLVRRYDLKCDFKRVDAYLYTQDAAKIEQLHSECELARRLGLSASSTDVPPIPFPVAAACRIPAQARIDPLAYVVELARRCHNDLVSIHEQTRVVGIEPGPRRWRLTTSGGYVSADAVIFGVHAAMLDLIRLEARVAAWQSYVIAARTSAPMDDVLLWDMMDPYHYTRLARSDDPSLVLIGGADTRTGHHDGEETALDDLERFAQERLGPVTVEYRWCSEFFKPADDLPYIGQVPGKPGVFIGTGYSGDGLSYGTAAGLMMADLAMSRESPYEVLFDPSRFKPVASAGQMAEGVRRMASHFIGGRMRGGEVKDVSEVGVGEGRILGAGSDRVAVFRDLRGQVHAFSAVCTHMGCIVAWNSVDQSWDCACHGSRFDAMGRVIGAPAVRDLSPVPISALNRRS